MRNLHAHLAVHRNKVLWLGQREHHLELLLRRVPGDVDLCDGVVDHVCTRLEEVVNRATNRLLVPRDWRRRDDHGVAVLNLYVAVLAVRHLRKARHWLTLRASRSNHERLLAPSPDLLFGDQRRWEGEIAEVACNFNVLLH